MNFELTDEQIDVKELVCDFMKDVETRKELEEIETDGKDFPRETMKRAAKLGFLGMNVDAKYGGASMSYLDAVIALEEFAYWSVPFSLDILVHNSLGIFPIDMVGTEKQKSFYLPRMATGDILGCFANTEPGTGADAKNIALSAKKYGLAYALNGIKHFCTNASESDIAILSARTSPRAAGNTGITVFIVDFVSPLPLGSVKVNKQKKVCQPGATLCEIVLENYLSRAADILGRENEGWPIVERTFQHSRIWIAAQGVGGAQRALDETIKYTGADRTAFGRQILDNQAVGFALAKLQIEIESARLLTYKAAWQEMTGEKGFGLTASMAKAAAGKVAKEAAELCYQYFGGISSSPESISCKLHRDIPIINVYEGPYEIQLMILWKNIQRMVKQISAKLS